VSEPGIGRDADLDEIEAASNALLGHTVGDIVDAEVDDVDRTKVKGQLGELLEVYYGMDNDNDPGPDFRSAGLELKCKPLKISYGDLVYPKEPLSVGMIDYAEVAATEYWRDIDKLERKFLNLLIVWFLHDGEIRSDYPFIWWQHWSPSEEMDAAIQSDYETIRQQILDGENLSESRAGNDILQTCPKHNSDFSSYEQGSYVVDSGHPELERPERRAWRIPNRFLVKMLADSADLPLTDRAGTEYVELESLWQRSEQRAGEDAGRLAEFIPDGPSQTNLDRFQSR